MVISVLETCLVCQKQAPQAYKYKYQPMSIGQPFHTLSLDIVGPFAQSNGGNCYVLVGIDHMTKWVEAIALPAQTAKATAQLLYKQIFTCHGCPNVLLRNNERNFTSRVVQTLLTFMGTQQLFSASYNPSTNGTVERVNGTLISILCKLAHSDPLHWDLYLPSALMAYQISYY